MSTTITRKAARPSGPIPSTMRNMVLSLACICALTGAALAVIYIVTKPFIDTIAKQKEIDAVAAVLPPFDNKPTEQARTWSGDAAVRIFPATMGGAPVGSAVETYSDKGYSKRITIIVGFSVQGEIRGLKVMDQSETPGLGSKMTESRFQSQFIGKAGFPLSVKKDGGDVDAISAATISSRAFCDALNRAYQAFKEAAQ